MCLYTKDVQILLGKSERQARRIHQEIRKHYNKESSPLLTIEEFCEYYRICPDEIQ